MADLKTVPTKFSVDKFLKGIKDEQTRDDCFEILKIMEKATKARAKMWGPAIVGFGNRMLKYPNGRELDWPVIAFSPRRQNMTLYVVCRSPNQPGLLAKLGKHTTSLSCLYIKKLSDVDERVLEAVVKDAYTHSKNSKGYV